MLIRSLKSHPPFFYFQAFGPRFGSYLTWQSCLPPLPSVGWLISGKAMAKSGSRHELLGTWSNGRTRRLLESPACPLSNWSGWDSCYWWRFSDKDSVTYDIALCQESYSNELAGVDRNGPGLGWNVFKVSKESWPPLCSLFDFKGLPSPFPAMGKACRAKRIETVVRNLFALGAPKEPRQNSF